MVAMPLHYVAFDLQKLMRIKGKSLQESNVQSLSNSQNFHEFFCNLSGLAKLLSSKKFHVCGSLT